VFYESVSDVDPPVLSGVFPVAVMRGLGASWVCSRTATARRFAGPRKQSVGG